MMSYVQTYNQLLKRIEALPHFHPCPEVNAVFSDLVNFTQLAISDGEAEKFLAHKDVVATLPRVQQYALRAETCLEFHWAERFAKGEDVRSFPYFRNYELLIEQEVGCVRMAGARPRHVLFVGAGPMPLSALLFGEQLAVPVTCVDMDWKACAYHRSFEGHAAFHSICSDVCALRDMEPYDLVVLAALVGETEEEKLKIVHHLLSHMMPGQLLLLRNSEGMKRILYPSLRCPLVQELGNNNLLMHFVPQNEVINTTSLFCRI